MLFMLELGEVYPLSNGPSPTEISFDALRVNLPVFARLGLGVGMLPAPLS